MVILSLLTKLLLGKLASAGIAKVLTGAIAGQVASSMTSHLLTEMGVNKFSNILASSAVGAISSYSVEQYLDGQTRTDDVMYESTIPRYRLPPEISNYNKPLVFGELNSRYKGFGPYNYNFNFDYHYQKDYNFEYDFPY